MATIKSYTDLEQSRKLAEILPLESADMLILNNVGRSGNVDGTNCSMILKENLNPLAEVSEILPCWSLAAMLEQLPYELCDDDGNSTYLQMNKDDDLYKLVYTEPYDNFESIETDRYENFVDACCEMIIRLKELNLL